MEAVRSRTRSRRIGYHCAEAELWLAASNGGIHTTPLAYAAFELRLEIERIAVEFLARIRGGKFSQDDLAYLGNFSRIENRIYELVGHQRQIDRKVEFVNLMLAGLRVEQRLQRVYLGELKEAWHDCSRLCHIEWSFVVDTPMGAAVGVEAYEILSAIQQRVRSIVDMGVTWFQLADSSFAELQERYVSGEINDSDVMEWFAEKGLWMTLVDPDGTARFVGEPITPRQANTR